MPEAEATLLGVLLAELRLLALLRTVDRPALLEAALRERRIGEHSTGSPDGHHHQRHELTTPRGCVSPPRRVGSRRWRWSLSNYPSLVPVPPGSRTTVVLRFLIGCGLTACPSPRIR